jgi:hypothetical protein
MNGEGNILVGMVNKLVGGLEINLREFYWKARGGGGRLRQATARDEKRRERRTEEAREEERKDARKEAREEAREEDKSREDLST